MSSPRLVRWRSLKLTLAEVAHARAVAQEVLAQRASDALLQQHRNVCQRKGSVELLDLSLLRWLEPIEQATAAAHLGSLAETRERSEERRVAANQGAQARKQLDLTRERVRSLEVAEARSSELRELDAQVVPARSQEETDL